MSLRWKALAKRYRHYLKLLHDQPTYPGDGFLEWLETGEGDGWWNASERLEVANQRIAELEAQLWQTK